jgi:dienelactone hydrolase
MTTHTSRQLAVLGVLAMVGLGPMAWAQAPKAAERSTPTAQERGEIEAAIGKLSKAIDALPQDEGAAREALPDVAVYLKAGRWALRLGEFFGAKGVPATLDVLARGLKRAEQLADGRRPWIDEPGETIRGYVSKVDGSVQPYAVIIPDGIDRSGQSRMRLDVVLHGRGATLNEVSFIRAHDGKPAADADKGRVTLHVFGRTNNAYRWAGEADVFEAIAAVRRLVPIDDRRVVLRGFSMGGAGAWHLGLHHPSLWSSVEAGAGFSETRNYAKLGEVSPVVAKTLHIYDAVDYAANAFNVPMVGYGGEEDPQRQASVNIEEALRALGYPMKAEGLVTRAEGIDFLRVVGAKMGHKVDPPSAQIMSAFHGEHAAKGSDPDRRRIKFVTYTLKYNRCAWLTIEAMQEHYRRAWVDAEVRDRRVVIHATENVAVLGVDRHAGETIALGGREFPLETAVKGLLPSVYFRLGAGGWEALDYDASRDLQENVARAKRHDVQGPIDDAFTGPFLCVRGTAAPWSPAVGRWADARLERFADDWYRYFRGEVRIKDDSEVTPEDIEKNHLILFGDPGSNRLLARILQDLPLGWTRSEVSLGGRFPAADHAPVLIAPNPMNPLRYVVVNSGHTFGAKEFAGTNALLYPRLGDYAVIPVFDRDARPRASGFFDEAWKPRE